MAFCMKRPVRTRAISFIVIMGLSSIFVGACSTSDGGRIDVSGTGGPTTTARTASPSPSSDDGPPTDSNNPKVLSFGPVSMAVPATYDLYDTDGDVACISPSDPGNDGFCDGIAITRGSALATASRGEPYDGGAGDLAWYSGTDAPTCSDSDLTISDSKLSATASQPVDGKPAEFFSWNIVCSNDAKLVYEQWYLKDQKLLFTNRGGLIMSPLVLARTTIAS